MLFCPIYYYQTVKISWGLSEAFMPYVLKQNCFTKLGNCVGTALKILLGVNK